MDPKITIGHKVYKLRFLDARGGYPGPGILYEVLDSKSSRQGLIFVLIDGSLLKVWQNHTKNIELINPDATFYNLQLIFGQLLPDLELPGSAENDLNPDDDSVIRIQLGVYGLEEPAYNNEEKKLLVPGKDSPEETVAHYSYGDDVTAAKVRKRILQFLSNWDRSIPGETILVQQLVRILIVEPALVKAEVETLGELQKVRISRESGIDAVKISASEKVRLEEEEKPAPLKPEILIDNAAYEKLLRLNPVLAESYKQAITDINNPIRATWIGPAHETREILRHLLDQLAPDEQVKQREWYKPNKDNENKPTRRQKVRYILEESGKSESENSEHNLEKLDDTLGKLSNTTYQRAAAVAHTYGNRDEAANAIRYLVALVNDLLP